MLQSKIDSQIILIKMQFLNLQRELEASAGMPLQLKINDNRATMLSVRWDSHCTKVSLHRIFLHAPKNVMESLVCYIKQESDHLHPNVKFFIDDNLKKLDYSSRVDRRKLNIKGSHYNLKEIYDRLNREYFDNQVDLLITWFGAAKYRCKSKLTFGLYFDPLRLIKINRFLDNHFFPDYVVSFIVYHEMLHHVCPAYYDAQGKQQIHNKEFKRRESQFKQYHLAQKWIKEHHEYLFNGII